jgi:hypothetical protein
MKHNNFLRLFLTLIFTLSLTCGVLAQENKQDKKEDKKMDSTKTPAQTPADTTAPTVTQISGVISSVSRHEGTSTFEIKVKDTAGKKHDITISPSAVIKQGDQKVAGSTLAKGTNVQIDAYSTPSGMITAKTITIAATTMATQK